jgi:hypothetical protein
MVNYRVEDGEILVGDFDHPDYWRTMRQEERVDVLEAMVMDLYHKLARIRDAAG